MPWPSARLRCLARPVLHIVGVRSLYCGSPRQYSPGGSQQPHDQQPETVTTTLNQAALTTQHLTGQMLLSLPAVGLSIAWHRHGRHPVGKSASCGCLRPLAIIDGGLR